MEISGVWYRSVDGEVYRLFYSDQAAKRTRPLWGLGASRDGARFTSKGGATSLYVAEDFETANREAFQVTRARSVKPPAGVVRVTFSVTVRVSTVLDLCNGRVRKSLGTNIPELKSAWRYRRDGTTPPTHILGRVAAELGLEGLRFPSTKGAGACLVIFTDSLKPGSVLVVSDGRRLLERLP